MNVETRALMSLLEDELPSVYRRLRFLARYCKFVIGVQKCTPIFVLRADLRFLFILLTLSKI